MTTETIDNPTWDDVREGDLVTSTKGQPDANGYVCRVELAVKGPFTGDPILGGLGIEVLSNSGYRVTKIVREVPGPVPDHPGAQVFTDRGVSHSYGNVRYRWSFAERAGFFDVSELPNPVEALPVPAKELRELIDSVTRNLTPTVKTDEIAYEFIAATLREWQRAGIDGGFDA